MSLPDGDKLDCDEKGGFNHKFLNLITKHYVIPVKVLVMASPLAGTKKSY